MGESGHDVQRFVEAQGISGIDGDIYSAALAELREGQKRSHWMWFVFPQLAGLGSSPMAQTYGVSGLGEARAYLAHEVLGPRLRECAQALLGLGTDDPVQVLGSVDAMKLRSSMTLFALADPAESAFTAVLDRYFSGQADPATQRMLGRARG